MQVKRRAAHERDSIGRHAQFREPVPQRVDEAADETPLAHMRLHLSIRVATKYITKKPLIAVNKLLDIDTSQGSAIT
jgi:hypothetical protein